MENAAANATPVYVPQMVEWFGRLDTEVVCALLQRWPALEELQKASQDRIPHSLLPGAFTMQLEPHSFHSRPRNLVAQWLLMVAPAVRERLHVDFCDLGRANCTLGMMSTISTGCEICTFEGWAACNLSTTIFPENFYDDGPSLHVTFRS